MTYMNNEDLNYKEARELILQPGKGRFQLLDKILLPTEIMGESVSVLLHRVCSRLTINKEEVSYIGFYTWVQSYRSKQKVKIEDKSLLAGESQPPTRVPQTTTPSGFTFSDPATIKNTTSQTTEIKFI
jgi:hypothetical protein